MLILIIIMAIGYLGLKFMLSEKTRWDYEIARYRGEGFAFIIVRVIIYSIVIGILLFITSC